MEVSRDQGQDYPAYRSLWVWLLLGWVVAYVDRTITGPVISYMIDNDLAFVAQAVNPYALGGLIGSMFFAGYILTQFPGGYLGDRFGHRTIIVISLFWAGIATLLSGLMTGLIVFVAFRVITGVGEGTFYSNDRTVITQQTPFEKRGLGMGIAIAGLPIGLTLALIFTVPMIGLGESVLGAGNGWRMPFFISGAITLVVGFGVLRFFRGQRGEYEFRPAFLPALRDLGKYSLVFLAAVMAIFLAADWVSLQEWWGGRSSTVQQEPNPDLHLGDCDPLEPLVLWLLVGVHRLSSSGARIFVVCWVDGCIQYWGRHTWVPCWWLAGRLR